MPVSFTDKFNIDQRLFAETGAFDTILDVDSRVFIDPVFFALCEIPEFIDAKGKVEKYFSDIITLLRHASNQQDMYWKKADKLLTFKEITGTCFGYSRIGTGGNAIGPILRNVILNTIKELIDKGENDPTLFELLGVFQEGIGCDRISDLLTFILAPEIYSFTQRVMEKFALANVEITYKGARYQSRINEYNKNPILLIPSSLLSPLPIAEGYDDIDLICIENERVRQEINTYFDLGRRKKLSKVEILNLMKSNTSFRYALLSAYKLAATTPYDFRKDPAGEYIWYSVAKQYVSKYPLPLCLPQNASMNDVLSIALGICEHFRTLIEANGLWNLLYDDSGNPKRERAAQLLFFGIADAYCTANNIDLSREVDNGRGFVDFKLSRGAADKIIIETKLTSNDQLKHGFTIQTPIYMTQEKVYKAIYLIIDNGHPKALDSFIRFYNTQPKEIKDKIPYIIVDGTRPKSASKA